MATLHRSLKVLFEKGSSREETLLGRDYLVVPCIAMVEGVRFGANQNDAELGLASEFGELPIAWANRPLVLNHPQIDGDFVSANLPEVLEDYQFGVTMNPELKDNKLHLEAWIDLERVADLGGEFEETLQRIQDEEEVEVSVGFFCEVEKKRGKFRGQVYSGIWRNIKPDHLAILSEGITGACSVADGCGIPRINQLDEATMAKETKVLKTTGSKTAANNTQPNAQCGCGGTGHVQTSDGSELEVNGSITSDEAELEDTPVTQKGLKKIIQDLLKPFTQSEVEKAEEAHIASGVRAQREQIVAQAIDPTMMDSDIRKMISQALTNKHGIYNTYLFGFNQNVAVFEKYIESKGYRTYQVGINVSEGSVEFVGEEEEVILQTKIIPQANSEDGNGATNDDADEGDEPSTQQKENDMSDEDKSKQKNQNQGQTPKVTKDEPTTQEAAPVVQTAEEYIAAAPAEIREMLASSMKVHAEKKKQLVDRIFKAQTNKFTEEYLNTQSVEVLENMAALLPGSYKGLAVVTNNSNPRVQEEEAGQTVARPQFKWGSKKDESAA